ncbi:Plastid division protein PDV1 [Acorus gramineus]|uniref:Plastid division protein PDV1 n=1 Tax=Acorus gramineus TaxID=55184 RepID=A0AAV9BJG3_ACOGR|nr:Plastid division protein PDV1 [Acorus gramineus]
MRWEMEVEEVEAVMEKIWDLHDKISDAIHSISRSYFLSSIKSLNRSSPPPPPPTNVFGGSDGDVDEDDDGSGGRQGGFVFVKAEAVADGKAAIKEARSLNAIRTALENLEDQLEFFHTVQLQQRAERDAAIARLEQSRVILAMRLAEHHGKKHKVIEEALAFVGDIQDANRFVSPETLFEMPRRPSGENREDHQGKRSNALMKMLISSFTLAKNSIKLDRIGGVLGNAALIAVGMLALLQLQQTVLKNDFVYGTPHVQEDFGYRKRDSSESGLLKRLDVMSARG